MKPERCSAREGTQSIFDGYLNYFDAMPTDVKHIINAMYLKQVFATVLEEIKEQNDFYKVDINDFDKLREQNETYMLTAPRSFRSGSFISSWYVDIELWKPLPQHFKACKKISLTYITFFCEYDREMQDDNDMEISIMFNTENATWFDLFERANFLIDKSKDHHHTEIEGFDVVGNVIYVSAGS